MEMMFMRFPQGKAKAMTCSYDDGCPQDKRLAELFVRYGIKATFNFCSENFRTFNYTKAEIREIFLSKGHEIAVHGAYHKTTGDLRPLEGIREVLDCRLELEERCGGLVRGMAYPNSGITRFQNGEYAAVRRYLEELEIAYARTLGGDNDEFLIPSDFYAWMPTAHHDNPKIMEYIDRFVNLDLSDRVYYGNRFSRLFYLWGHSYELDKHDNWEHIEEICKRFASFAEDIWFANNIEICDYVEGYRRLRFRADETAVYNPSVFPIWLEANGKVHRIDPDTTVLL